jgi:HSP20 family protein
MKNENIFESDSPTIELEARNLRQPQQGQQLPYANGLQFFPYTGAALNPAYTPYAQQPGFANYQGLPVQTLTPQYIHPGYQPQQFQQGTPHMQPFIQGNFTPQYPGVPAPYIAQPYPINQLATGMQTQQVLPPYQQSSFQVTGNPAAQPMAALNPVQSPYLQPAINIADGQLMMLPYQPSQFTIKNGNPVLKNGERDFISWYPNVNILENDRSFKIEICVPGVAKENCRINIDKNNILRISGSRRWNQETDAVGFTRKEFNYGSFSCSFVLTENLHKDKITSSCRNGLLIISIPKREGNESEDRSFSDISVN